MYNQKDVPLLIFVLPINNCLIHCPSFFSVFLWPYLAQSCGRKCKEPNKLFVNMHCLWHCWNFLLSSFFNLFFVPFLCKMHHLSYSTTDLLTVSRKINLSDLYKLTPSYMYFAGLMFRRIVYTECTQPCTTITTGDPMDVSVVELSLVQTYIYILNKYIMLRRGICENYQSREC